MASVASCRASARTKPWFSRSNCCKSNSKRAFRRNAIIFPVDDRLPRASHSFALHWHLPARRAWALRRLPAHGRRDSAMAQHERWRAPSSHGKHIALAGNALMDGDRDSLMRALLPLDAPPAGPGWNHAEMADLLGETPRAPAAVMLGFRDDRQQRLVLTVRTHTLSEHAGQVALPGGRVDEGDASVVDAALREAEEEIGL